MRFHFVKQLDAMQCGVACLAMICKYYKNAYSIEALSKLCSVSTEGVSLFAIKNAAEKIGFNSVYGKENGSLYSYKNGKIYLTRDTSLPSQYQKDIWTSTKGVVFSPFSTAYEVTVTRGEIPIKQVLPEEELNLVIQNATTGKEYIYTIALLNPEDKIIQFIPVTFKMK